MQVGQFWKVLWINSLSYCELPGVRKPGRLHSANLMQSPPLLVKTFLIFQRQFFSLNRVYSLFFYWNPQKSRSGASSEFLYAHFVHEEQYVNQMLVIIPPCVLLLVSYLFASTGLKRLRKWNKMFLLLLQVNSCLILVNNSTGCISPST